MRRWENESSHPENVTPIENAPETEIPKSKRKRATLNEEHLLSWNGLKRVYHSFPYRISGNIAGNEVQALDSLLSAYQQWAFDLHPGYPFDQFLDRVETLGKNPQVRDLLQELREQEHTRPTTETIQSNAPFEGDPATTMKTVEANTINYRNH